MERALACPSCGKVIVPVNPGIAVIQCEACDSTLYRDDQVLRAGVRSIVGEPRGPVAVGATGRVGGERVAVVGRVRLSHASGSWDEWYLGDRQGAPEWLVEDEKRYALEAPVPVPDGAHEGMVVGDQLTVQGVTYEVREVGDAVVEGIEGQVPRAVEAGQAFRYVDLSELWGERVLLLEFAPGAAAEVFAGRAVPAEEVELSGGRRSTPQAEAAKTIRCPSCGAPYAPPSGGEPPKTASCAHCDAVLALDTVQARVVGQQKVELRFDLELGDRGELLGSTYEVMGRLSYRDPEGYRSDEFLLWSADAGYLWLEKDNGNYAWMRAQQAAPSWKLILTMDVGDKATFDGHELPMRSVGRARLDHVDGALPWAAAIDDVHQYVDFSSPPLYASVEKGPNEVEAFAGSWIDGEEVLAAFGRAGRWVPASDVHIAQPNPNRLTLLAGVVCLLLAVVNLGLAATAGMSGEEVVAFTIPSAASGGQSVETPSFTLDPADGALTTVEYRTKVDNSWVWIDLGLLDDETDTEFGYTGKEVGYYHGVEGGESWSEGSRTGSQSMRTPPAGTYYLEGELEYDRPTPVDVRVVVGQRLSRYNIALALLFGILGLIPTLQWGSFEKRRREDA